MSTITKLPEQHHVHHHQLGPDRLAAPQPEQPRGLLRDVRGSHAHRQVDRHGIDCQVAAHRPGQDPDGAVRGRDPQDSRELPAVLHRRVQEGRFAAWV